MIWFIVTFTMQMHILNWSQLDLSRRASGSGAWRPGEEGGAFTGRGLACPPALPSLRPAARSSGEGRGQGGEAHARRDGRRRPVRPRLRRRLLRQLRRELPLRRQGRQGEVALGV